MKQSINNPKLIFWLNKGSKKLEHNSHSLFFFFVIYPHRILQNINYHIFEVFQSLMNIKTSVIAISLKIFNHFSYKKIINFKLFPNLFRFIFECM